MFIFKLLLMAQMAFAGGTSQQDIDRAFELILTTSAGQAICTHILGASPEALEMHLGLSKSAASRLAKTCGPTPVPDWLYPTKPSDIRKLTIRNQMGRTYQVVKTLQVYPIESWTDNFTNTTIILTESLPISRTRLVQVLAHEMAVYFDSKANPQLPDAQKLPQLASLDIVSKTKLDPLLTLSDPLIAHTLTFARALKIERSILEELVQKRLIEAPSDFNDHYLNYLLSDRCTKVCLEHLIVNMREAYIPLSLALLAFAPSYRAHMLDELPKLKLPWTTDQWRRTQMALYQLPVEFLKNQTRGDSMANVRQLFLNLPGSDSNSGSGADVIGFLNYDLWPLEWKSLDQAKLSSGTDLLDFMKVPLLSGYNIMLSSGPRVRVRTGNIE